MVKPSLGHSQFPSHRDWRYIQRLRDLIHGEPRKIAQFDRFTFPRIELLQRVQATVQSDKVPAPFLLETHGFCKRYSLSGAFARSFLARMVHQDLTHQSCSYTEEMRPALPVRVVLINQPHIRLMDDRRGLQSVVLAFLPQAARGKLAELLIHQRRKVLKGLLVSLRPLGQQSRHIVGSRHGLPIDNADLLPHFIPVCLLLSPLGTIGTTKCLCVIDFDPGMRMSRQRNVILLECRAQCLGSESDFGITFSRWQPPHKVIANSRWHCALPSAKWSGFSEGGVMKSAARTIVFVSCLISVAMLSDCGGGSQKIQRLTITTASLPNGTIENQYSQPIQAHGGIGPFHWAVSSGTLPHNLALSGSSTSTVMISGTPDTAAQAAAFTVKVTDSGNQSASQRYTVSILLEPDTLTLSPPSLGFAPQLTGTSSGTQAETVTNTGISAVVISSTALTGTNAADFGQSSTCSSSLTAGANCTFNVAFTPSQLGPRSASIAITDSTVGSPHSVSLGGVGLTSGPNATWSATSMTFAPQLVGTTSPAQSVRLSNYGTTTVNITGITVTADFGETDNCGSSLASAASCTVNVTSTPSAAGKYSGTLLVTDNEPGSPQTVSLNGAGSTGAYKLTGRCLGFTRGTNQCVYVLDLSHCPLGQLAVSPRSTTCGQAVHIVDGSTACSAGPGTENAFCDAR